MATVPASLISAPTKVAVGATGRDESLGDQSVALEDPVQSAGQGGPEASELAIDLVGGTAGKGRKLATGDVDNLGKAAVAREENPFRRSTLRGGK